MCVCASAKHTVYIQRGADSSNFSNVFSPCGDAGDDYAATGHSGKKSSSGKFAEGLGADVINGPMRAGMTCSLPACRGAAQRTQCDETSRNLSASLAGRLDV